MRTTTLIALIVLLATPAFAADTVTFETKDGMKITGTHFPSGKQGAPGVVALHMYRHERSTWKPVAEMFAKAGIDFLAIDMRGHGASAVQGGKDLTEKVNGRDAAIFNAMWQDALAGRDFLVGKGTDKNRIGLLGASVGCSVAIHAASKNEKIVSVCVMTPGANYLGVDTMSHLAGYGDRPILILSSKEEAGQGATAIKEKLSNVDLVLFPEKRVHGTRMFGKVEGVEKRIVTWFSDILGAGAALDGKLSESEKPDRPLVLAEGKPGKVTTIYARIHGSWLHVVVAPMKGDEAPHELDVAWAYSAEVTKARSVYWSAKANGYQHRILRDGKWMPMRRKKAANARDPGAARGEVIEMLLPVGEEGVGLTVGPKLQLLVFTRGPYGDVTSKWKKLPK